MQGPEDGIDYPIHLGKTILQRDTDKDTDKGLFLMKYEFMPHSIDPSLPGSFVLNRKRASVYLALQNGEHATEFQGSHKDLRSDDSECILLWNEASKSFTLEKLDSAAMTLRPTRKKAKVPEQLLREEGGGGGI